MNLPDESLKSTVSDSLKKIKAFELLLIPEVYPGKQRQTCRPTLSTNQMRPWDWLGASECLHVPIQPEKQHQHLLFLHLWQGDSRKSQYVARAACSVTRKLDQAATNS